LRTTRQQLAWGRVAVFAGSFELDVAEHVCGEGLTTEELLDTLTSDRHLPTSVPVVRLRPTRLAIRVGTVCGYSARQRPESFSGPWCSGLSGTAL
jgi:hypothetical protein